VDEQCLGFDIWMNLDNSGLMDICTPHRGSLDAEPGIRRFNKGRWQMLFSGRPTCSSSSSRDFGISGSCVHGEISQATLSKLISQNEMTPREWARDKAEEDFLGLVLFLRNRSDSDRPLKN
jgi:hypothetical protein